MFTHSIRWRLQLWLAFLLVGVLGGFIVTVRKLQEINQLRQIDEELQFRVAALSAAVRRPPPFGPGPGHPPFEHGPRGPGFDDGPDHGPPRDFPGGPPPDDGRERRSGPREIQLPPQVANLFEETRTNGFYFAVWSRDGALLKQSTNSPAELPLPGRRDDSRAYSRMRGTFREAFHFTELGDCVLAGRSITVDLEAMSRFTLWLLAAGGGVLALGLGGGWWLTARAIRPVENISAAASRISAGNLSERISGADEDNELGRLAGVLNSTFARLESAFAQQKQFTADASHELRTPLAVLISEAQTTLARERSAAEYRETVEACLDTAQRMRRLTESLLELARFDAGQEQIERSPRDLADIAREGVERIRPLARAQGLKIECDLQPAKTSVNAERFGQVLTNLLTNAIHHNKPRGEIRVSTRTENGAATLTVADTGTGIAAEDLPRIFERFYRADKSRSGTSGSGRNGLGLAISKAIVEAHGGKIEVSSQPGVGSEFTVRLPV